MRPDPSEQQFYTCMDCARQYIQAGNPGADSPTYRALLTAVRAWMTAARKTGADDDATVRHEADRFVLVTDTW